MKRSQNNENNQRILNERNEEPLFIPEIYSIKDVTNNKTESVVLELIRHELDFAEDEVLKWNKMLFDLFKIRISNDNQIKCKKILISINESFCNLK